MEDGSTLGTILTYVVLAIVLLAIAFGITRAAWFFSMLVAMNLASRRRRAATGDAQDPGEPATRPALRDQTGPDR